MGTIKVAVANHGLTDWEEIEEKLLELKGRHGGNWELDINFKWFLGEIPLETLLNSNGLVSQSCL